MAPLVLYNLFGDPATRLMTPQQVQLEVQDVREQGEKDPNASRQLKITAKLPFRATNALFTFERSRICPPPMGDLAKQGPSIRRFELANQRIIASTQAQCAHQNATCTLQLPEGLVPGFYLIKLYATGEGADAMGGVRWQMKEQP